MVRRALPLIVLAAGCLPAEQPDTRLVQPNPFAGPPQPSPTKGSFAPASAATDGRVRSADFKEIVANSQIGMRPVFRAVGSPRPELSHKGTSELIVSEGLVRMCRTDGELAAVLCLELGRMVSEREAQAGAARTPDYEPPVSMS